MPQPRRKIAAEAGAVTGFLAWLRQMGLFLSGVGLRVL